MPSPPITEHLTYLLAQANREINRQLDARLKSEGVQVEQWRILKVLSDGSGRSMGELAEAVLLNHPTLTKTIDRMVANSLVYRIPDPQDRRKVLIFCSDRGMALSRRLNSLALSQEAHIVDSWGDKATNDLKRLLESLIESAG
ncbi:MarR family winged helix-turn-helix transcriptional regulator [Chelatococcus reniformis]|jgi:DNA-binding MarR family transcriptional regulator|uniref:Transcriptional regulator n=1 Tax=Chelatococcus reniformis TaxID=1494448 RepID=A0A916UQC4_9HYPH|nr:MarR family transcriptional regulator [Chelatococcus reniformis]GGC83046.1 transcriptional regulator [Chelatococcus reniformis]